MHIQTFSPVPRRCRWFTAGRAGLVFRVPFVSMIVCVWRGPRGAA
jgi:hypothetical protein